MQSRTVIKKLFGVETQRKLENLQENNAENQKANNDGKSLFQASLEAKNNKNRVVELRMEVILKPTRMNYFYQFTGCWIALMR